MTLLIHTRKVTSKNPNYVNRIRKNDLCPDHHHLHFSVKKKCKKNLLLHIGQLGLKHLRLLDLGLQLQVVLPQFSHVFLLLRLGPVRAEVGQTAVHALQRVDRFLQALDFRVCRQQRQVSDEDKDSIYVGSKAQTYFQQTKNIRFCYQTVYTMTELTKVNYQAISQNQTYPVRERNGTVCRLIT